jgi:hypothetical protein
MIGSSITGRPRRTTRRACGSGAASPAETPVSPKFNHKSEPLNVASSRVRCRGVSLCRRAGLFEAYESGSRALALSLKDVSLQAVEARRIAGRKAA